MKASIFHDDFLLQSKMAIRLYHGYAAPQPLIDYHNHLPPAEIAENRQFANLTEIWLNGDHYKWRAMRALAIPERLITGEAPAEEKFRAWAACLPNTLRNPLFHWSQLELLRIFGEKRYLNPDTADSIYCRCNELLTSPDFQARGLMEKFKVELAGTTDDPCDDLEHHRSLVSSGVNLRVIPTFRPDKVLQINEKDSFFDYLDRLELAAGIDIRNFDDLLEALDGRINHFDEHGCRMSDHGLTQLPMPAQLSLEELAEFTAFLSSRGACAFSNPAAFSGHLLLALCERYHRKGWVQQFHLGAMRNNNSRLLQLLGADAGVDSVGDYPQAASLSAFLNTLDVRGCLAKTILYNLNPADNELFAAMCGNFNTGPQKGWVQFGTGWWFLDQKDGMERQLNTLSYLGILSTFIGMTTDSRSFLSWPRHEYFRRVLCNLLGQDVEQGLLPDDEQWLGGLVADISYNNIKAYIGI
jgi:glucuronate isomerase